MQFRSNHQLLQLKVEWWADWRRASPCPPGRFSNPCRAAMRRAAVSCLQLGCSPLSFTSSSPSLLLRHSVARVSTDAIGSLDINTRARHRYSVPLSQPSQTFRHAAYCPRHTDTGLDAQGPSATSFIRSITAFCYLTFTSRQLHTALSHRRLNTIRHASGQDILNMGT
jgi:hypothetical protein